MFSEDKMQQHKRLCRATLPVVPQRPQRPQSFGEFKAKQILACTTHLEIFPTLQG